MMNKKVPFILAYFTTFISEDIYDKDMLHMVSCALFFILYTR